MIVPLVPSLSITAIIRRLVRPDRRSSALRIVGVSLLVITFTVERWSQVLAHLAEPYPSTAPPGSTSGPGLGRRLTRYNISWGFLVPAVGFTAGPCPPYDTNRARPRLGLGLVRCACVCVCYAASLKLLYFSFFAIHLDPTPAVVNYVCYNSPVAPQLTLLGHLTSGCHTSLVTPRRSPSRWSHILVMWAAWWPRLTSPLQPVRTVLMGSVTGITRDLPPPSFRVSRARATPRPW